MELLKPVDGYAISKNIDILLTAAKRTRLMLCVINAMPRKVDW